MERTVLNAPKKAAHARSSALLLIGRWLLFLSSVLGILVWRLGEDGGGALDTARKIGFGAVFGSFLAAPLWALVGISLRALQVADDAEGSEAGLLRPVPR